MATTYGSYFPGITDGLVFNFDPKNKKCWSGGETVYSFYPGESLSGSGANTGGSDWDGTLTTEGYFSLDGTDGELIFTEMAGNSLMTDTDATICFWLRTTDTQLVFMKPVSGGGAAYFAAQQNPGGWYEGGAPVGGTIYNNGVVDMNGSFDGNWHYYVFTDVAFVNAEWNNLGFSISGYTGLWDIDGDIGPVQIYNRVLSTDECSLNYNVQKQRFGL